MPRALISVSDKRGIVAFAQGLVQLGWEIASTGGTAATLRAAGVDVIPVDEVTGFAELLEDVVVKTVESGSMTKDLALLVGRDQEFQSTEDFLASLDENLSSRLG